ncbi:S-adenosyl-L-methionine-dependent methyltransferases superfamily protein [Striga hermonthica]|uniref:S-adenosyl-L-methionine-dependent methyltransferases superfamily protein n=1 Tax=Striga hermonthica TaxID=68872 RepID=A0A9N7NIN2_STRHE|nr:S-adenosyl-L-methionine-dependent methyltransferases superfamily protein [Striga hermonthica]
MASLLSKGVAIFVSALVLTVSAAILVFLLSTCLTSSPCSCPPVSPNTATSKNPKTTAHISPSHVDIEWVKSQILANKLQMHRNIVRKGINPRTREQQLQDLQLFKGLSHYEGREANNHTLLPCPGNLLVEEHHSNYGEPWAVGRDIFEFLVGSANLNPNSTVLELGCGTLRVGLHFIRFLDPERYHCLELDDLSIMAALRYELPSQGLLHKRPLIVKGEDMDFGVLRSSLKYDMIYGTAASLHMPRTPVWTLLRRIAGCLRPEGLLFVSENMKFCTRLGGNLCNSKLKSLGLEYIGNKTQDCLLFNHYKKWFAFRMEM